MAISAAMAALTQRQQEIIEFIRRKQQVDGETPSLREIASHFGFRSMNAALSHVQALRRKGVIENHPRRARSLRLVSGASHPAKRIIDIPLYGSIPAGFPDDKEQEAEAVLSIDSKMLGARSGARLFALKVQGDSMVGKQIVDGDFVVVEHGRSAEPGEVVAALIDGESTLKTFLIQDGKPHLRAENPKYPELIPADELVIQGVMIALIRTEAAHKRVIAS